MSNLKKIEQDLKKAEQETETARESCMSYVRLLYAEGQITIGQWQVLVERITDFANACIHENTMSAIQIMNKNK